MENDLLESLADIGYEGPLLEEAALSAALDGGVKSLEYTKLIHIISDELSTKCKMEERISVMQNEDDSSSFLLELSSFLKELGCPYKRMVTGHMSSRLRSREDRILLLDYLLSELMAARMVTIDQPKTIEQHSMEIVVQESPTARDLKNILISLKFNKPPPNISIEILFSKVFAKLKETIEKEGQDYVGRSLYNKALTPAQWKQLEERFIAMQEEYRLRREMLITRLECTVQSFEWADRLKDKKEQIQEAYRPKRAELKAKPEVRLSDFLAARTTLLQLEKTSGANVRKNTSSGVNKVVIGRVPDRGGRPQDQQPPPPEMPPWLQRGSGAFGGGQNRGGGRGGQTGGQYRGGGGQQRGGSGQQRGGGGQQRGGGGRVQGGWNDNKSQNQQQYNSGYQNNRHMTPTSAPRSYQTYEIPQTNLNKGYQTSSYIAGDSYNQQASGGNYYGNSQSGYQSSQGYQSGYQTANRYQNEHDDRTQSGRSNYNRGGRR